jgi:hypothetical protein
MELLERPHLLRWTCLARQHAVQPDRHIVAGPYGRQAPRRWGNEKETPMPIRYLYATRTTHLAQLLTAGLDPATAPPSGVRLYTPSYAPDAVLEVMEQHNVPLTDVILLAVRVPRRWLQHVGPGLWQCLQVIAPARLAVYATGEEVAASPVAEEEDG